MKLTKKELEMLDGKYGDAVQKAIKLLVVVGECYGAQRMVSVASAHLSAANPVSAGKGGAAFIKEMAETGGKFVVPTTTNPTSLEPWDWKQMGFSGALNRAVSALSGDIAKMGGFLCNTCTPYLIGHAPRMREHIAWCESSAIIYANAVLGSRTNREGGPTALAAGLTGRTPAYGYHLNENRYGKLKIKVSVKLKGDTDYATLGYFAGRIVQDRVPVFTGLPASVSQDELKCLGSALACSGSAAHYHVVGVTPEAPSEEVAIGSKTISSSDVFEFGFRELKETEELISKARPEEADLVVLGCPHASINQLRNYANILSERKVKDGVEIWILVSHPIKKYADDTGYANIIETSGASLVSNTCPAIMPRDFFNRRGYKVIATDSAKMTYYASTMQGVLCYYGSLGEFIDVVTNRI